MSQSKLIQIVASNAETEFRLVCFPYAGGSGATYQPWRKHLSSNIELALLKLPGRGERIFDNPIKHISELVTQIVDTLALLPDKKTLFFGHSLGAIVAYEVMRKQLYLGLRLPEFFIASGSESPCFDRSKNIISTLNDAEFKAKLKELGGTPTEVLENAELMSLIQHSLRADFQMAETYQNQHTSVIPSKVAVFLGTQDNIPSSQMLNWQKLFQHNLGIHHFDGGHFFVDTATEAVVERINTLVKTHIQSQTQML